MHWKCNFIESISVFILLFVCLFSFLLIELILNNVICKFYIQHVDTAMEIIENSYGEDLHYLLWRMAALCSFSCISGGKCENSRGCTDLVPLSVCNADISGHLIKHHLSRESCVWKGLNISKGWFVADHWWTDRKDDGLLSSSSWARKVLASAENLPISKTWRKKISNFWNICCWFQDSKRNKKYHGRHHMN